MTRVWPRMVFLVLGAAALLTGLDAALTLLRIPAPVTVTTVPDLPATHGELMTLGFVGTLIALERAVALRRPWGYAAPALLALGSLAQLAPATAPAGRAVVLAGALVFVLVYVPLWRRQRDPAVLVQALGTVAGACAAGLLASGLPTDPVVPWLAVFMLLTIGGERLELARLRIRGHWPEPLLLAISAALLVACAATLLWPGVGYPILGFAILALAGWLFRYDVARATLRSTRLPRFVAACLLAGYAWLIVAGGVYLLVPGAPKDAAYDAALHAVFLGFVMSMIMAHAPVILPAVLRRPLPYSRAMWIPAVLLHATLLIRLVFGDARGSSLGWQVGGVGNVVAVLTFLAVALWSGIRGRA